MSLKSTQSQLNLSNGFKKRVLRPVSTQKQNDPKSSMKNSNLLSLHDRIKIKNKYAEARNILQSVQELFVRNNKSNINRKGIVDSTLQQNLSSFQKQENILNLQKLISVIKQKKQRELQKINEKSKKNSTKSIEAILNQIGAQNLQQGLKILYMQSQQMQQFLQQIIYFLVIICSNNNFLNYSIRQNPDLQVKINENEQNPVIIARLLAYLMQNINNEQNNEIRNANSAIKESQQMHGSKFKAIITYDNEQMNNQLTTLRQQLQTYKLTNKQLQTKLKSYINKYLSQKNNTSITTNNNQPPSINQIQAIHKQIKQIYEQSLTKKDQLIQKLKTQLLYTQHQLKLSSKQLSMTNTTQQFRQKRESLIINNNTSNCNDNQDKQYLSTIQQQFEKMRHGFNKKLQSTQRQNNQKQLKLKKQLFNLQKQLQNTNRQKTVLYKKYQFLLNQS